VALVAVHARPQAQNSIPRSRQVRRVWGWRLGSLLSRDPRRAWRRALSSSYIHLGISGSCAGWADHTISPSR
jgi:hypothetical protein